MTFGSTPFYCFPFARTDKQPFQLSRTDAIYFDTGPRGCNLTGEAFIAKPGGTNGSNSEPANSLQGPHSLHQPSRTGTSRDPFDHSFLFVFGTRLFWMLRGESHSGGNTKLDKSLSTFGLARWHLSKSLARTHEPK